MADPAPNWYADPTTRYELRYWDGTRWTEHVASGGVPRIDPPAFAAMPSERTPTAPMSATQPVAVRGAERRRTPGLGWAGLILCLMAFTAVAVPGVGYLRAQSDSGVRIGASPRHLDVPAHHTYGVYVDDADNSGYSESCTALDEGNGRPISMRGPSWSMSSSDTETLDLVFDSGTGKVSISCSVPGERVTVREVPHYAAMLLGLVLSIVLGILGVGLLIAWAIVWFARHTDGLLNRSDSQPVQRRSSKRS